MVTKRTHLRLVDGGGKPRKKSTLAVDRPLIRAVPVGELDPKKGLRAQAYLLSAQMQESTADLQKGRSRIYPEINVLNSAKGWYRRMIRLARSEGYTDMKKFFKESDLVGPTDKKLFESVGALIDWENKNGSG